MSVRQVLATLTDGPRKDVVLDAVKAREYAHAQVQQALVSMQMADQHLRGVLAAVVDESPDGLQYDPDTSAIYRDVKPAKPEPKSEGDPA